ncbi:hypothetical protein AMTR_s00029p00124200 [Amborella trichopoda]|uniref:Uncharacterized protein n=1 Tax=Amborella trichopoda TaxID=13333 RepID=W1PP58_AMBTC|nr:hypothetical protein AMTR_s00029p00124200 [Amborella trichopoda]
METLGCEGMERIIAEAEEEVVMVIDIFPKLRELRLCHLTNVGTAQRLQNFEVGREWWEGLEWEYPNILKPKFIKEEEDQTETETETENESVADNEEVSHKSERKKIPKLRTKPVEDDDDEFVFSFV